MTSPEREAPKTSTEISSASIADRNYTFGYFFNVAIKGGGRSTRLLPHAKMLLVLISFFLCWVDYALEGSTFSLSKCDFSRLFHTERSWHTYRFTVVFVSGRQDLPSDARAFSLTSFEEWSFLLRLNKGLPFLQSAFWIWTTKRFWVMPRCILATTFSYCFPPFFPVPARVHPHSTTELTRKHQRVKPQVAETRRCDWNVLLPRLRTNGILQGKVIRIEDFFRGRVKTKTKTKKEFFGGEALIFTQFFRGRPIFCRDRSTQHPYFWEVFRGEYSRPFRGCPKPLF